MWWVFRKYWQAAEMNGAIKYLEYPTQLLKHNRNSVMWVATLVHLIKIYLLIFLSPCCAVVGQGPWGSGVLGKLLCGLRWALSLPGLKEPQLGVQERALHCPIH